MSEHPILFSTPMVQAILSEEKTQTRRIAKLNVAGHVARGGKAWHPDDPEALMGCPFGQPGDILWVRETWNGPYWDDDGAYPDDGYSPKFCHYKADGRKMPYYEDADGFIREGWSPSIHMPRWASRITLAITAIRLERLQDISEQDARAEGIAGGGCLNCGNHEPCGCSDPLPGARESFIGLWNSINGAGSWDADPLVWVIEFEKKEQP